MTLPNSWSLNIPRVVEPEALVWLCALLFLGLSNPKSEFHFTLFWPSWFFDIKSPGYGLGHSISWLFRGEVFALIEFALAGNPDCDHPGPSHSVAADQ